MTAFHSILGAFLQSKALQAPFLPKFPPNLPKFPWTCPKNNWKNMTSKKKKRLHFDFGRHFCKIKAHKAILRRCSHILPKFTQIFPGFSWNQNLWGWAPTPCTPASYTTGLKLASKNFHATRVDARKSRFAPKHLIRFARNVRIQRSPHPRRRLSLKFEISVCDRNSNTC